MSLSFFRPLIAHAVLLACRVLGYNPSAFRSFEARHDDQDHQSAKPPPRSRRCSVTTTTKVSTSSLRISTPATATSLPRIQ